MMKVLYKCIDCKNPYSQRSTILILTLTLLRSDPELLYATGLDNHVTHAGAAGSCCVNACIARSTPSRFPKPDRPAASITETRIKWELKEKGEELNEACTFLACFSLQRWDRRLNSEETTHFAPLMILLTRGNEMQLKHTSSSNGFGGNRY